MLLLMDPGEMYYDYTIYITLYWYSNCHFKGGRGMQSRERKILPIIDKLVTSPSSKWGKSCNGVCLHHTTYYNFNLSKQFVYSTEPVCLSLVQLKNGELVIYRNFSYFEWFGPIERYKKGGCDVCFSANNFIDKLDYLINLNSFCKV